MNAVRIAATLWMCLCVLARAEEGKKEYSVVNVDDYYQAKFEYQSAKKRAWDQTQSDLIGKHISSKKASLNEWNYWQDVSKTYCREVDSILAPIGDTSSTRARLRAQIRTDALRVPVPFNTRRYPLAEMIENLDSVAINESLYRKTVGYADCEIRILAHLTNFEAIKNPKLRPLSKVFAQLLASREKVFPGSELQKKVDAFVVKKNPTGFYTFLKTLDPETIFAIEGYLKEEPFRALETVEVNAFDPKLSDEAFRKATIDNIATDAKLVAAYSKFGFIPFLAYTEKVEKRDSGIYSGKGASFLLYQDKEVRLFLNNRNGAQLWLQVSYLLALGEAAAKHFKGFPHLKSHVWERVDEAIHLYLRPAILKEAPHQEKYLDANSIEIKLNPIRQQQLIAAILAVEEIKPNLRNEAQRALADLAKAHYLDFVSEEEKLHRYVEIAAILHNQANYKPGKKAWKPWEKQQFWKLEKDNLPKEIPFYDLKEKYQARVRKLSRTDLYRYKQPYGKNPDLSLVVLTSKQKQFEKEKKRGGPYIRVVHHRTRIEAQSVMFNPYDHFPCTEEFYGKVSKRFLNDICPEENRIIRVTWWDIEAALKMGDLNFKFGWAVHAIKSARARKWGYLRNGLATWWVDYKKNNPMGAKFRAVGISAVVTLFAATPAIYIAVGGTAKTALVTMPLRTLAIAAGFGGGFATLKQLARKKDGTQKSFNHIEVFHGMLFGMAAIPALICAPGVALPFFAANTSVEGFRNFDQGKYWEAGVNGLEFSALALLAWQSHRSLPATLRRVLQENLRNLKGNKAIENSLYNKITETIQNKKLTLEVLTKEVTLALKKGGIKDAEVIGGNITAQVFHLLYAKGALAEAKGKFLTKKDIAFINKKLATLKGKENMLLEPDGVYNIHDLYWLLYDNNPTYNIWYRYLGPGKEAPLQVASRPMPPAKTGVPKPRARKPESDNANNTTQSSPKTKEGLPDPLGLFEGFSPRKAIGGRTGQKKPPLREPTASEYRPQVREPEGPTFHQPEGMLTTSPVLPRLMGAPRVMPGASVLLGDEKKPGSHHFKLGAFRGDAFNQFNHSYGELSIRKPVDASIHEQHEGMQNEDGIDEALVQDVGRKLVEDGDGRGGIAAVTVLIEQKKEALSEVQAELEVKLGELDEVNSEVQQLKNEIETLRQEGKAVDQKKQELEQKKTEQAQTLTELKEILTRMDKQLRNIQQWQAKKLAWLEELRKSAEGLDIVKLVLGELAGFAQYIEAGEGLTESQKAELRAANPGVVIVDPDDKPSILTALSEKAREHIKEIRRLKAELLEREGPEIERGFQKLDEIEQKMRELVKEAKNIRKKRMPSNEDLKRLAKIKKDYEKLSDEKKTFEKPNHPVEIVRVGRLQLDREIAALRQAMLDAGDKGRASLVAVNVAINTVEKQLEDVEQRLTGAAENLLGLETLKEQYPHFEETLTPQIEQATAERDRQAARIERLKQRLRNLTAKRDALNKELIESAHQAGLDVGDMITDPITAQVILIEVGPDLTATQELKLEEGNEKLEMLETRDDPISIRTLVSDTGHKQHARVFEDEGTVDLEALEALIRELKSTGDERADALEQSLEIEKARKAMARLNRKLEDLSEEMKAALDPEVVQRKLDRHARLLGTVPDIQSIIELRKRHRKRINQRVMNSVPQGNREGYQLNPFTSFAVKAPDARDFVLRLANPGLEDPSKIKQFLESRPFAQFNQDNPELLEAQKELEQAEKDLEKISTEIDRLRTQRKDAQRMTKLDLTQNIKQKLAELKEARKELDALQTKVSQLEEEEKQNPSILKELSPKAKARLEKIREIRRELKELDNGEIEKAWANWENLTRDKREALELKIEEISSKWDELDREMEGLAVEMENKADGRAKIIRIYRAIETTRKQLADAQKKTAPQRTLERTVEESKEYSDSEKQKRMEKALDDHAKALVDGLARESIIKQRLDRLTKQLDDKIEALNESGRKHGLIVKSLDRTTGIVRIIEKTSNSKIRDKQIKGANPRVQIEGHQGSAISRIWGRLFFEMRKTFPSIFPFSTESEAPDRSLARLRLMPTSQQTDGPNTYRYGSSQSMKSVFAQLNNSSNVRDNPDIPQKALSQGAKAMLEDPELDLAENDSHLGIFRDILEEDEDNRAIPVEQAIELAAQGKKRSELVDEIPVSVSKYIEIVEQLNQLKEELSTLEKSNGFWGRLFRRVQNKEEVREQIAKKKEEIKSKETEHKKSYAGAVKIEKELKEIEKKIESKSKELELLKAAVMNGVKRLGIEWDEIVIDGRTFQVTKIKLKKESNEVGVETLRQANPQIQIERR